VQSNVCPEALPQHEVTNAVRQRRENTICRLAAGVTVALALLLALKTPYSLRQLPMPDPWAYRFAVENFAQGKWVVTDREAAEGRKQARLEGGHLTQYVQMAPDRWVLEKAPGYPLLAVPFQWVGMPRLANVALALLAALALYVALAAWRDEFVALLGVTVFSWSPISVAATHYAHMDTFASGALLVIGGALSLWYDAQAEQRSIAPLMLFAAGLASGWAVLVRLPSVLLLGLIVLYLALSVRRRRESAGRSVWLHLGAFGLGCALALAVLAIYNLAVFDRLFDTGYRLTPYRSFLVWGTAETGATARSLGWLTVGPVVTIASAVVEQITLGIKPLILGWPLLPLVLVESFLALRDRQARSFTWWTILWLLVAFLSYAGFAGLSKELTFPFRRTWGFFMIDRYVFPAALPITLLATSLLARLPRRLATVFALAFVAASAWLSLQALTIR
jgi:hypothetical protein